MFFIQANDKKKRHGLNWSIKKSGEKHHARLHILEILSENIFFIFKNKIHSYKRLKKKLLMN
jgi:hypothetical protein